MNSKEFFNLSLKQTVNPWLCITLMCVMCFGIIFYYTIHKVEDFSGAYASSNKALTAAISQ